MPIVKKSLEEMLDEIGFESFARYDFLVPLEMHWKVLFTFDDYLGELSRFLNTFSIEITDGTGRGDGDCPTAAALSNAYSHGNKEQDEYAITVKVFTGKRGAVIRIRDSGEGFDFEETARKFESGERYFYYAGGGFRTYATAVAEVAFERKGSTVNLMYLFGGLTISQVYESRLVAAATG